MSFRCIQAPKIPTDFVKGAIFKNKINKELLLNFLSPQQSAKTHTHVHNLKPHTRNTESPQSLCCTNSLSFFFVWLTRSLAALQDWGGVEGSNILSIPNASFWSVILSTHFHFTDSTEPCLGETNPRSGGRKDESPKRAAFIKLFFFHWKAAFISDFIYHVRGGSLPVSRDPNNPLTSCANYRAAFAVGE